MVWYDVSMSYWHKCVVGALAALLACGGFSEAKVKAKTVAASPATIKTVPEAIAALKAAEIIRTAEQQESVLAKWRAPGENKKAVEMSKKLLAHLENKANKPQDYPCIEEIIHLFHYRSNKHGRFPTGALEPFFAVPACRPKNMPLLVQACYRPLPEREIKLLLTKGENPNAKDADGETALHAAARCCLGAKVLRALIKAGARVNEPNNDGYTPLHLAAQAGADEKSLRVLLEAGADQQVLSSRKSGMKLTPVMMAMECCTLQSLQDMANAGMDLNAKANMNCNALYLLCQRGISAEELAVFLQAGADVNERFFIFRVSPAVLALYRADEKLVRALLAAGADFTMTDASKQTALHYLAGNEQATSAMFELVHNVQKDVNAVDSQLYTPLHTAAFWGGSAELVKCLLKAGANKDARTKKGKTPLDIAREKEPRDPDREKKRQALIPLLAGDR